MARYKTGNSAKNRRDRECDGYRNYDTAVVCIVVHNDRNILDYMRKNGTRVMRMKKDEKLRLLERKSTDGFGEFSARNVSAKELNRELKRLIED